MLKRIITLCLAVCLAAACLLPVGATAPGGSCTVGVVTYVTDRETQAIYVRFGDDLQLLTGGEAGYTDGSLAKATFADPRGIVPFKDGLLVADCGNHALRYIDLAKNRVYTYAGRGTAGYNDSTGRYAAFDSPVGLAVDEQGNVYVADSGNHAIRKLSTSGKVTTLVGGREEGNALGILSAARLSYPTGLCYADGTLYVADSGNHRILAIRDGKVSLVAGATLTGDAAIEGGYLDGPADLARFASPAAVAVVGDAIYVADAGNAAIRVIRDGYVTTIPTDATTVTPDALLMLDGELYVGDSFAKTLTPIPAEADALTFDDVPADAAEAVRFATVNGLMNGTGDGHFSPDATVTLGMVTTILARLDGMDTSVGEAWYTIGMQWAKAQSIIDAVDPAAPVSRAALDRMLARYIGENASIPETNGQPLTRLELAQALMTFLTTH